MVAEEIIAKVSDIPSSYVLDDDIRLYQKYLSLLPNGSRVLDLGTGWGKSVVAMALSNPNVEITTIDDGSYPVYQKWSTQETYLERLNQRFQDHGVTNIKAVQGDLLTMPLPTEDFDLLHLDMMGETEAEVLKRWLPKLKNNGYALIRNFKRFEDEACELLKGFSFFECKGLIQITRKDRNMTIDELMSKVEDCVNNYNLNTFEMFLKYIPSLPAGNFVDFGTGWAKSAVAIALLNPCLKITTLDIGHGRVQDDQLPQYVEKINQSLKSHGVDDRVTFHLSSSLDFPWTDPLIGLNIDSGHSYELTKAEIERWVPFVQKGGLIFLDDYLVERVGVKQAVDESILKDDRLFEDLNPNGMNCVFRKK